MREGGQPGWHITIIPRAVSLTLTGNQVQRATRSRLAASAKCTLDCTLSVATTASVKVRGHDREQKALNYTKQLKLATDKTASLDHAFTGNARTLLRKLVKRHRDVYAALPVRIDATVI